MRVDLSFKTHTCLRSAGPLLHVILTPDCGGSHHLEHGWSSQNKSERMNWLTTFPPNYIKLAKQSHTSPLNLRTLGNAILPCAWKEQVGKLVNSPNDYTTGGDYSVEIKISLGWCGSMDWVLACEPKGCQFNSQSEKHAWVLGQVSSRGHMQDNHTLMFLSFSFSLPSPLSKNK